MKGRLFIVKKIYEEPMIVVEQYALTQNVASCDIKIGFQNSECVKNDPEATDQMKDLAWSGFFNGGDSGCGENNSASGMDGFDSICSHTNVKSAFNS